MNPALVCIPTYNERENIESIVRAVLAADPRVDVLVVDDNSPDGTGELADALARESPRVHVLHRAGKDGLGKAYLAAFDWALEKGYAHVLEMDADWSHDPRYLPALLDRASSDADLVLGSRWVAGGGTLNWGLGRQLISRGGSLYARTILGLGIRDLTGGFKCFRRRGAAGHRPAHRRQHRLRVPDRADLPGHQARLPGGRGPHRLRGPSGGSVQDVPGHRARGPGDGVEDPVSDILSSALVSLSAVFFVVDPIGVVPIFIAMTHGDAPEKMRATARRASVVAGALLVFFALFGTFLFKVVGVSLSAFRVAGGIVLLITALDMLRARQSETRTSPEEAQEATGKEDVAIVPLAIPLLAGPGAIATVMVLMSRATGAVPRGRGGAEHPRHHGSPATSSSGARRWCSGSSGSPGSPSSSG